MSVDEQQGTEDRKYAIQDLVQASGVPRRTIRYYVQRGLLAPPEGAGRGHYYRSDQLHQLLKIRDLQGRGFGLEEIRILLEEGEGAPAESAPTPDVELVTRIRVLTGIDLIVSHGVEPPTPSRLRALAIAAAQILEGK